MLRMKISYIDRDHHLLGIARVNGNGRLWDFPEPPFRFQHRSALFNRLENLIGYADELRLRPDQPVV